MHCKFAIRVRDEINLPFFRVSKISFALQCISKWPPSGAGSNPKVARYCKLQANPIQIRFEKAQGLRFGSTRFYQTRASREINFNSSTPVLVNCQSKQISPRSRENTS